MDEITKDERFAHITKDPRFRSMPKKQKKVKIDNRFKSMFHDKRFKLKYSVDKRGKPMNFTTNENLKKYYELSEESESESDDDDDDDDDDDEGDEEDALIANLTKKVNSRGDRKVKKSNGINVSDSQTCNKKKGKAEKVIDKTVKRKHGVQNELDSIDEYDDDESKISNKKKEVKKGKSDKFTDKKKAKGKNDFVSADESDEKDDVDNDDYDDSDDSERLYDKDIDNASSEDDNDSSEEEDNTDIEVGEDAPDYARGEGLIESSSEDDSDNDDEEIDDGFDHQWGELDKNVPEADELTSRLAVCNMDWDRIKAQDLFVLFNSFKSSKGVIKSVRIYPSEFGLQRMKEEQVHGPTELKELGKKVDVDEEESEEEEEEDSEGNRYHREKLRQYQLNRLKYYYAVVECDSVETANNIYNECDGREYESSSARLDLRYIPDGMTFNETPRSECLSLPDTSSYKSSQFFTSALCQSKVDLTWDETDQDRIKTMMKKYDKKGEVNEDDFKAYLASDSEDENNYGDLVAQSDSEDISDEDKQIEKYKNLLKDIDDSGNKQGDMEMEIDWDPGLKEVTEDIVKTKEKNKDQTPWEHYLQQKKEKKKQKKAELKKKKLAKKEAQMEKTFSDDEIPGGIDLNDNFFTDLKSSDSKKPKKKKKKEKLTEKEEEDKRKEEAELALLMMDEGEDGKQHFNLKDIVEKKKKKKNVEEEDDFEVDVSDNRFDAVFKSHMFNIDPSAPEYKKTKGMEKIIEEKLKRRKGEGHQGETIKKMKLEKELDNEKDEMLPRKEESLSSLVKSVKAKTQHFKKKKKHK